MMSRTGGTGTIPEFWTGVPCETPVVLMGTIGRGPPLLFIGGDSDEPCAVLFIYDLLQFVDNHLNVSCGQAMVLESHFLIESV